MPLDVNSNGYTLGFATLIVVGVAVLLSGFSVMLKSKYDANVVLDKKSSILASVDKSITKVDANSIFDSKVESFLVDHTGKANKVETQQALDVDLKKELKKDASNMKLPFYTYKSDGGKTQYILPMRGNGLWDEIWGYMSFESDFNTVSGVSFDHAGETPGLGAEITKDWFQDNFLKEQIFNKQGEFVGIQVLKGKNNPKNKEMHKVDGMSGATITGDGVQEMIEKCIKNYLPYIKQQKA